MNAFLNNPESEAAMEGFPTLSRGLVILCLMISLAGIANHDLWTPDEPREAALALSMHRTGNRIIPNLAGDAFVEKPPLFYIVASTGISLLGAWLGNTSAVRLTSVLWGLGTLAMTYLMARRLWNRQAGRLALLVLALMPGFVHVTHWILVDTALMFFVAAAFWCLTEAYVGRRWSFLPLAGVSAAGAFLSKGFVGPLVIALGGIGLLGSWIRQGGWAHLMTLRMVGWHSLALMILVGVSGSWMLALRNVGGPELWHEWFWTNHLGRFTGQATALGHQAWIGYYAEVIPLYVLPWIAAWIISLGVVLKRLRHREPLESGWPFLLGWGLGGLILLTLSSTKREIYLSVLLPAFALMIVPALREPVSIWVRRSLNIWLGLMFAALAVMVLAPALGIQVGMPAGERWMYSAVAIAFLGMAAAVMIQRRMPWLSRWGLVTALTYIAALSVLCPLVDRVKSYGPAFRAMASRVANAPNARVAAWAFDETSRAGFYYYCDLVFPPVSDTVQLESILKGSHPRFTSILTLSRRFPPPDVALPPWKVLGEARMGNTRCVQWIGGHSPPRPDSSPDAEQDYRP